MPTPLIIPVSLTTFRALLLLGLLVRTAALPLPGTEDVDVWKIWSFAGAYDPTGVYGVGGTPPERRMLHYQNRYTTVDYPPLALLEMAAVGRAYRAFDPVYANNAWLVVFLKLPGLCAGLVLTWLLHWVVGRLTASQARARWTAVAYWLNPAMVLNAEVLGYLDPLMMLPALGALLLMPLGHPVAAGAASAAALLTKPQALLIGPAVLLALAQQRQWMVRLRVAAGGMAVGLLTLLPFAAVGALPNMWLAFGSWYGRRDILSGNAANVWWVANYLCRAWNRLADLGFPQAYLVPVARVMAISTFMEMGFPNPRPFGTALVVVACGWAGWRLRHRTDAEGPLGLTAFTIHAFFVLGVGVHEHHQVLSIPVLACLAGLEPGYRRLFYATTAIVALNMNLFYGLGRGWDIAVPRMLTPIDLTVLVSLANLAALAWHARLVQGLGLQPPQARPHAAA